MNDLATGKLTLGPLLFHWSPAKRRDFYFRIADEAELDCVYLGEVVCSKREPFFEADIAAIVARLEAAGKQVVRSTLALMTLDREVAAARALAEFKTATPAPAANDAPAPAGGWEAKTGAPQAGLTPAGARAL